jgi:hypothetical protein
MNYALLVAVLLLASVGVSALGSGLSLRRFCGVGASSTSNFNPDGGNGA